MWMMGRLDPKSSGNRSGLAENGLVVPTVGLFIRLRFALSQNHFGCLRVNA